MSSNIMAPLCRTFLSEEVIGYKKIKVSQNVKK